MSLTDLRATLVQAIAEIDALLPPAPPVVHVAMGGSIQAALDAAVPGTTIRIAPGVYPGKLTLRAVSGASVALPITIRPDVDDSQLPAAGVRVDRAFALVTIQPAATDGVGIQTDPGAAFYTLLGLTVAAPSPSGTIVALGAGTETSLAQLPHDITIDRCVLSGGWAVKRGLALNCGLAALVNSAVVGVMKAGQDTQCISGWNGPGPFLIQNNLLDGGTETLMFGGADPTIPNLVPSDITIRGNSLTKSLAPMQATKATVKNSLELKNAQRVLIEGNVLEHAWVDEQAGWLLQLTVRNQGGTAPWSTVRDVEIRYNVIRHGWQGVNILALDDDKDSAGNILPSVRMQNVNIHDNLFYDLGAAVNGSGSKAAFTVNNGPIGLTIAHNTVVGALTAALTLTPGASKVPSASLIVRDNILPEGSYGITDSDGSQTVGAPSWLAVVDAASLFDYNQIAQGMSGRKIVYPGAHTVVQIAGMTFDANFVASPVMAGSDGKTVGCDLAGLHAAIADLDLSK